MTQDKKTGGRPARGKPFKNRHKKIGGRKKGTPNLMDAILETAAQLGGEELVRFLREIARNHPREFLKLLGRVLPKPPRSTRASSR